jgi:hypothetical protein
VASHHLLSIILVIKVKQVTKTPFCHIPRSSKLPTDKCPVGTHSEFVAIVQKQTYVGKLTNTSLLYIAAINEMANTIGAQLAGLFKSGNGRRLSAAEASLVDEAQTFLSDAMTRIHDMNSQVKSNIEGRFADLPSMERSLNMYMKDIGIYKNYDGLFNGSLVHDLIKADSLDEAAAIVEKVEEDICTAEEYIPSEKMQTKCTGHEIKLVYEPKECVIDEKNHVIDCTPAKLVLKKIPGGCTFKHHTAPEWKSKECKMETEFEIHPGKSHSGSKGGDNYTLYIDTHNFTMPKIH